MPRRRRNTHSSYVYPFPKSVTVGRIDQGQDFGGRGAILAIGNAKIVKLGAPGWPGGENGILYKLLDGPRKGQYVYVYEGVTPSVRAGQLVHAGETIGHLIPGSSTGIETGWSRANGEPVSHAEYHEGLETKAGKGFALFLAKLKEPGASFNTHFKSPAERKKFEQLAENENLKSGLGAVVPGASLADELLSGLLGDIHAEALMLNIGLIGGGAFLVYYGAALMLGVKKPGKAMATLAEKGPAGAAGFKPPEVPE
jgi:hypothetical protein